MTFRNTGFCPRSLVGVTLAYKTTAEAVATFGLCLVTFFLPPPTRLATRLRTISKLPLSLLRVNLDASSGNLSGARVFCSVLHITASGHGRILRAPICSA